MQCNEIMVTTELMMIIILLNQQFPLTSLREIKIMKLMNHTNVLGLREVVHSTGYFKSITIIISFIFGF